MNQAFKRASDLVRTSERVAVLTGAGISAESGIQTFRDAGGLWENHSIESVATPEGFRKNPRLVWNFYNARRRAAKTAAPNAAHCSLARLESAKVKGSRSKSSNSNGNSFGGLNLHQGIHGVHILTQNIDGLHQAAGSRSVLELHGNVWKVRCTVCGQVTTDHPLELPLLPYCAACGGLLRPHIVWFGETLDLEVLAQAETSIRDCDLFLVIGTSAVVQPAASYPFLAERRGIPVIEINREDTPVTAIAAVSLRGTAGDLLPKIIDI